MSDRTKDTLIALAIYIPAFVFIFYVGLWTDWQPAVALADFLRML